MNEEFLQAYDRFADAIFRHCFYRVFDRGRAQELMQETFMRTWQSLTQGKKIENLRAFLYRVANNLIIDQARKKKAESLEVLQEGGFEPAQDDRHSLEANIEGKDMTALLASLDPKYRDVLVLRYINDLNPKEIAEIVGESENNVSVRIHRGLKQIRDLLQEDNG